MTRPPYRVPTMQEVRDLPWNGYQVASFFAGGGGSSTGYRMAGYRVLYANEFVPAAADTYRANCAPYTFVDGRDIRTLSPSDVLDRIGLQPGELDVLDGSPPCASFSTAGQRDKGWGKVKTYSDTKQRSDDLFFEYARMVRGIQPKVFVAENVTGLVKGTAKGYFKRILAELTDCGYRVSARVLDGSRLGLPQARQRLIFVGVRDDLGVAPAHPRPLPYSYAIRDVLPHVIAQGDAENGFGPGLRLSSRPSGTIGAGVQSGNRHDPPGWAVIHDTRGQFSVGDLTDRPLCTVTTQNAHFSYYTDGPPAVTHDPETGADLRLGGTGAEKWRAVLRARGINLDRAHTRKLTLAELRALCGFPPDYVLTGTYSQRWERCGRAVPPVMMRAIAETIRDEVLPQCAD